MCGFAGFFGTGDYERAAVVDAMGEKIVHRGPDSAAHFVDDSYAVAFRRLSIIDLAGGTQPMKSADGRYVITFNGEIYNYRDIRAELIEKHGCTFATDSDTEVLLQTYVTWGAEGTKRLRGMFAFSIYDTEEHVMFAARDYFGIKPFYYAQMNGHLLFGSEIKSFLAHPAFEKKVNKDALKMYLIFQYTPLAETMFAGVYKLEPGHWLRYDGKTVETGEFFEPDYEITGRDLDAAMNEIKAAMDETVRYHQIADVEVGSFLSGGVDSSYVAAMARPDKTFSVGFEVDEFDETGKAAALCKKLGMKNRLREIAADEFFAALPEVQYFSDEPHANLSAVPLYFLSQMAAEDLKVVLSGEGADELFGGYDTYKPSPSGDAYRRTVPRAIREGLGHLAESLPPVPGLNFLRRNALDLEDKYIGQAFIMDNEKADRLLKNEWQSSLRYQDVTAPLFAEADAAGLDELHKKLYLDMRLWLPNDILLKADKMTMAHSLELRVPYLDKEIWALSRTLPTDLMVQGEETKLAFRKAAESVLPTEWAERPKKGFPVPLRVWLRDEKYCAIFREMFEQPFAADFFDQELLLSMLEEHKEGKRMHQRELYTVYSFLLWYQIYFVNDGRIDLVVKDPKAAEKALGRK